jgi:phospholipid/cholesterol/gamma-HCH transport system substrate-binding protein
MTRAIREHLRDFIAIAALFVVGLLVAGYILSQQQQPYPEWLPFLGDDRFEVKAELSSAQAVTPGQGQTVNIAGVKSGDISEVELVDGKAVVTMLVEQQYAPILRSDATVLLRPRTGLQDMTLEVDPGRTGAPLQEGATIPLAQTQPNVQPDQILASLDRDTRDYLTLLIEGGAEGLGGRGEQLSAGLRRFEPLGRYLAQIGDALSVRRRNIARTITSFRALGEELGKADTRLSEWVSSQNAALGAFANQEASIRETLRELPSALVATRKALESGETLANELGPASEALIPAAQAFGPAQQSAQALFTDTYEPIRDQIRPFAREVQKPVRHLKQASQPLAKTTKGLAGSFSDLNRLFNAIAYNPPGAEEGYLFWLAWLNHNTNGALQLEDANGPLARGSVLQSCNTAYLADQLTASRPYLRTVQEVTNVPPSTPICELDPPPIPRPPIDR